MLILSATYNSYLQSLVPAADLRALLKRTITFLGKGANISPSLRRDMQHLKQLERQLFPRPVLGMSSSFSSTDI